MATNGLLKHWDKIIYIAGLLFLAGVLFANVSNLRESKAEKSVVNVIDSRTEQLETKTMELCESKLDKTVFTEHQKRDDERFEYIKADITKRLDRIENKLDNLK